MEDKQEFEKILEASKEIMRVAVKDLFGEESLTKVEDILKELSFDIDYDPQTANLCDGYYCKKNIFLTNKYFQEKRETSGVLIVMIHELAHAFSDNISKDRINSVIEEATANLFAETCMNYYMQKNGEIPYITPEENAMLKQQRVLATGYEKEGEFLGAIIYPLQKQGRAFESINEYLFGSKKQYVDICKEVLGEDFSQVLKNLKGVTITLGKNDSQEYIPKASEAMKHLLTKTLDATIDGLGSNLRKNLWKSTHLDIGLRTAPEGRLLYAIHDSEILRQVHSCKLFQEKYDTQNMTIEEYINACVDENIPFFDMKETFKYIFEGQSLESFEKSYGDHLIKNNLFKDGKKLEDLTDEDVTRFIMSSNDFVRSMYKSNGYKHSDYVRSLISSWYTLANGDLNRFKEITMITGTIPMEQLEQIIQDNNLAKDLTETKLIGLIQEYDVNTKDRAVLDDLIKYYDDSEKENCITQVSYGENYEITEIPVLGYIMNTYKNLDSKNAISDLQTLIDMQNDPNKNETTKFILDNIDYNAIAGRIEQLMEIGYFDQSIPENQKAVEDIRNGNFSDINLKFRKGMGLRIDSKSDFLANYYINQTIKKLEEAEEIDAFMQFSTELDIDTLYKKIDDGFDVIDVAQVNRLKELFEAKLEKHHVDAKKLGEETLHEQEDTELKRETEAEMESQQHKLEEQKTK